MYQETLNLVDQTLQDQKWFLSGLYNLETIRDEQEETEEYVQNNFRRVLNNG